MNGDGMHYFDLGKFNFHPDDIYSHNVAMIYAIAKEFNKVYNKYNKKYSGNELEYKVINYLYKKGFNIEDIKRCLNEN